VDEEISAKVIDFLDRNDPKKTNKPFGADTLARAQTTKQQCINTCRARYRDFRRLNQLPSFECWGV
jgi:hypothetical protein